MSIRSSIRSVFVPCRGKVRVIHGRKPTMEALERRVALAGGVAALHPPSYAQAAGFPPLDTPV